MKTIDKSQLLSAIAGKEREVEIPGIGNIKIKSLEFSEVKEIQDKAKDDMMLTALYIVRYGLVEPALTDEDIVTLYKGQPGKISKISAEISKVSGMVDEENFTGTTS